MDNEIRTDKIVNEIHDEEVEIDNYLSIANDGVMSKIVTDAMEKDPISIVYY